MTEPKVRCLILACGNTLRSDDGIGPWLAQWAQERFGDDPNIRVISRQQWTPDLAEDIAQAESVLFIDCSIESAPGSLRVIDVEPSAPMQGLATHHQGAPELLALSCDLYNTQPRKASLLTIGAGSTELGETFSEPVLDAIPEACRLLEETILNSLRDGDHCK
ncbi:MAG: hydrogenase maturation protease [Terracidiphilus sp.]